MKIVEEIRQSIEEIDGAIYKIPSELAATGPADGRVRKEIVWRAIGELPETALAPPRDSEHESEASAVPEIEELLEFGAEIDIGRVKRALEGGPGEEIRKSVMHKGGVGALAFYSSFHQKGGQWGIYVCATSLLYLAATVFDGLQADLNTKLQIAFRALHQHELFHFAVDYMAAQCEGILEKPCYVNARKRLRDPEAGYILIEEELANAYMIRALRGGRRHLRIKARVPALREFAKRQPPGYKDGGNSTSDAKFETRSAELARHYIQCVDGYSGKHLEAVDLVRLLPINGSIDWRYCPILIVHDEDRLDVNPITLSLFQYVRGIDETPEFTAMFDKLSRHIQDKWSRTKHKLGCTTALPGLDFKLWKRMPVGNLYSVRVDRNYRAHLRCSGNPASWAALEIGTHRELGHG